MTVLHVMLFEVFWWSSHTQYSSSRIRGKLPTQPNFTKVFTIINV